MSERLQYAIIAIAAVYIASNTWQFMGVVQESMGAERGNASGDLTVRPSRSEIHTEPPVNAGQAQETKGTSDHPLKTWGADLGATSEAPEPNPYQYAIEIECIAGHCRVLSLVPYIYDLRSPPVFLPTEMAQEAADIWLGCEVRTEFMRGDDVTRLVSKTGDYGQAQINEIHRGEMANLGLDFERERDRLTFAVVLWKRNGWEDWSCGQDK